MLGAVDPSANPWAFQAHPEVWLLVASLVAAFVYAVRVIGPRAVGPGEPVATRRNVMCFAAGMALLWGASDWPVHDVGEKYLYGLHMLQHMILTYFVPPLLLLALPEWLARTLVGSGRLYATVRWLAKPVAAAFGLNALVMITHIPGVVNASVDNGALHYTLHFVVVMTALIAWMPVCGPFPELRLGPSGQMLYLFAMSLIPTVPAGWLVFAEGSVYDVYDHSVRVFGLSVTDDQQIAGLVMKIGGSIFLWTIITVLFFGRFMANWEKENSFARRRESLAERPLTYADVEKEFARVPPPVETAPRSTE